MRCPELFKECISEMSDSSWLEVSMVVDPELAEAVAEVLARFAPGGVVVESTDVAADDDNQNARAVGPLRVAAYLRLDDKIEQTRHRLEVSLWYLGRIRPLPEPQFRLVKETDWAHAWREHYHPILIGKRLLILPAWIEAPEGNRIPIRMDPGMAFGTGTHPTTQLCLEYLEEFIDFGAPGDFRELDVMDIGCGSGILSAAAIKLGARCALAVDIDQLAVEVARENAVLNRVESKMDVEEGSLTSILDGEFLIKKADLVFANILAHVLIKLLDQGLGETLTMDGLLVLSGIIEDQEGDVLAAVDRNGLQIVSRKQIDDWVALGVQRSLQGNSARSS